MSLLQNYQRVPVTFVAGDGCDLIDDEGRRYLDMIAGIGVCALGHAHPTIAHAIAGQATRLVHVSNLFHHQPAVKLATELARRSGLDRVFFCNSGTEANEAAIKLARKYAFRAGREGRHVIVSCTGGFHGRTLGALAATPNPAYQEGFGPMPGGFRTIPFNDVSALQEAMTNDVAALIIEPVQGESGVFPASEQFLSAARAAATRTDALLIFDEVQCGMGRVGPLFAFQHFRVVPDVATVAKALANGLPIGAMLVRERFAATLQPGDHGSTFGGSPLACVAAVAHLQIRDQLNLRRHVPAMSSYFFRGLRHLAQRYPTVYGAPRGIGLLVGLPVCEPLDAAQVVESLRTDASILANKAGSNTVRFAPPLIVRTADIERVLGALDDVGARLSRSVEPPADYSSEMVS